jgi:hypothetical protein
MRLREIGLMLMCVFSFGARAAVAQEPPTIGIAMGYPASVGVLWHVTDTIALRPELSLLKNSGELTSVSVITFPGSSATSTTTSTTDSWQVGVGVSGLLYVRKWDELRAYVSPRFSYMRTSSKVTSITTSPFAGVSSPDFDSKSSTYLVSGSFGAQYALGKRFGVFGEVGVAFQHNVGSSGSFGRSESTGNTINTRSGAGVLFYF